MCEFILDARPVTVPMMVIVQESLSHKMTSNTGTTRKGFTLDCKSSTKFDVRENSFQQSLHINAVSFV